MKKLFILLALLAALGGSVRGQGQSYTAGPFPQSGWLYVCPVPSGGTPCPSPSSIFSNAALSVSVSNPILMSAGSTVSFFAASGQYTIQFPSSGYSTVVNLAGGGVSSVNTWTADQYFKSGRPWYDVVAFGADPTGVADSTSAIQAAFNAWKAFPSAGTAGTLFFPSGIYLLTTSIDATGATFGGIVEGAGVSSYINCQLGAANACFDFTGSQYVTVRDLRIGGDAAGLQSAAILNARSLSNTRGDFPFIENIFVTGTFSKVVFANISADEGTYFRDIVSPTSVPTTLFVGCTDALGVTSAYATFAAAQGCTYYHVIDSSFTVTTPTTVANVSTISQSTTTLTITVPAASPIAQGQTFTLLGTLSTTATTLTVLTSTQGIISGTTSGAHNLVVGDRVVIAGVTPSGLNKTCTIATVPSGTTFTCNAGNGLADLVGTIFGTVTRTWDEDYVAATVSGSTITSTLMTSVTDTGLAAGTIKISGEGIRAEGVASLQVDNTFFGFGGNGTAAVRTSGSLSTNIKFYNVRIENNSNVPFSHVVDAYSAGIGMPDISGRFNVLGSLFRAGVGQTISKGRFMVVPASADSSELLFDGGGNVSQVTVLDGSVSSYSFNIGSGSAQNYFFHPTGKTKQFVGTNSTVIDGTAIWMNASNVSLCKYDSETCTAAGRLNLPTNLAMVGTTAAGGAGGQLNLDDNVDNIRFSPSVNVDIHSGGIVWGGNLSSVPGLFHGGITLQSRLGNNTGDAPVSMSNLLLSGTGGAIQNVAGTATMGLTRKAGTGAGNYSSASTTVTAVDGTNLTFTVTIPTGWKLGVEAAGAVTTSTAIATATVQLYDGTCNTGTALQATQSVPTAATNPESWSLADVITGDGASHTINLCYATSNGADSVTMINSSAALSPRMKFELMPSN